MKINRKDVYRVAASAITDVNRYGTKIECDKINTYFGIPVRNSHGRIITLNELVTGRPLVKYVYTKNECFEEYEEVYYPYAYDKKRDMPQIGDIEVEVDQDYETSELQQYVANAKEAIDSSLESLELRAIAQTSAGYNEGKDMDYYNKPLYICPLYDDDFIIVSATRSPLGPLTGFRELITGRKVIKHTETEYDESDRMLNLNRSLMDPEIDPINFSVLATRELTVKEFEEYMDLTPEEVEAKISNYLAKLSRERLIDYKQVTK